MPQVKPEIEAFAKIKVVGVGGGGGSAVNRMVKANIKGVDFMVMNTDMQALHYNMAPFKLHIGKSVTRGLGAGMDPEVGRKAAEESQNEIREALKDTDMVFITCGLGGGTGSGASPIVAEVAKELGALTVAVVTKPFDWEGPKRKEVSEQSWQKLARNVDAIITVPNERILQVTDKKTSFLDAFKIADEILHQGVRSIAELITMHGVINVDFADVKTIMRDTGSALMGIGSASGENRAIEAAKLAISSPLLELSIDGAHGILFTVTGGPDLTMSEVDEAAKIITASASSDAKVIFGAIIDESLVGQLRISVIATGFDDRRPSTLKDEESTGFVSSGHISRTPFAPSNFGIRTIREEEEKEKQFLNITKKPVPPSRPSFQQNSSETSSSFFQGQRNAPEQKDKQNNNPPADDDLQKIPTFIRRKMGL